MCPLLIDSAMKTSSYYMLHLYQQVSKSFYPASKFLSYHIPSSASKYLSINISLNTCFDPARSTGATCGLTTGA